ncbi:MAG: Abi family protein [Gammaproteobacteria bacterium]
MKYTKPHKTIEEQIILLKDRGLLIRDELSAKLYLKHLNYYRLAGYWITFEKNDASHKFKKQTTFEDILNLYNFDKELRLILLDAIECVEVSIRTQWAYHFAKIHGSHAYLDCNLSKKNWHETNLKSLQKEIERSDELFIKHYQNTYTEPLTPPIWVICEIMSFGVLSRWFKALKPGKICSKISKSYQLDYSVLSSFIEHLTYIRNLCAHHSRIWNKRMTKTMRIPKTKPKALIKNFNDENEAERKLYNSLVMLLHILNTINPKLIIQERLIDLIKKHPQHLIAMGFPHDWSQREIWK